MQMAGKQHDCLPAGLFFIGTGWNARDPQDAVYAAGSGASGSFFSVS